MTEKSIKYSVKKIENLTSEASIDLKKLTRDLKDMSNGKLEFFLEDMSVKSSWIDGVMILLDSFPSSDKKVLKDFIMNGFASAETMHPGAGYFYLLSFIQGLLYGIDEEENLRQICKFTKRGRKEDILESLNIKNDFLQSFINFAVNSAGFGCSFSIKDSKRYNTRFLLNSSCQFPIKVVPEFLYSINKNELSLFDSRVIVIDGIVETVGEIHHLLEKFSENKLNLILMARGFEPDVLNTLSVNYKRGSLKVFPAILQFGLDSVNSLKDVSIVCNAPFISSMGGETISSIDTKKLKPVHHIEINAKNCKIRNPSTSIQVKKLIYEINKKISSTTVEEKKDFLQKRSSYLKGRKAVIYLGDHLKSSKAITKNRILSCIGILNTASRYGILSLDELNFEENNLKNTEKIVRFLKDANFNIVPAASFIYGSVLGFKTANQLKNGSYALLLDRQ